MELKKELLDTKKDFDLEYLNSMVYTDRYINEIFRIYYNGIPNGRMLQKSHEFSGYKFKKG